MRAGTRNPTETTLSHASWSCWIFTELPEHILQGVLCSAPGCGLVLGEAAWHAALGCLGVPLSAVINMLTAAFNTAGARKVYLQLARDPPSRRLSDTYVVACGDVVQHKFTDASDMIVERWPRCLHAWSNHATFHGHSLSKCVGRHARPEQLPPHRHPET